MNGNLWEKRIPTLLGIVLTVVSIAITSTLIKNPTKLTIRADISKEPHNITITNISDSSFNVSYTTDESVTGSINYYKEISSKNTENEDFDKQKGTLSPRKVHSITIKNLISNTKYFFVIISGQTTYQNNNVPFEITTAPIISSPTPSQNSITGNVIFPNGKSPNETIIYLDILNGQTLSTILREDGSFTIPTNLLRFKDLLSYLEFSDDTSLKLTIINDSYKSNVLSTFRKAHPVPTITLSNDYDFTINTTSTLKKESTIGFSSLVFPKHASNSPKIKTASVSISPTPLLQSNIISTPLPTAHQSPKTITNTTVFGTFLIHPIIIFTSIVATVGILLFLLTR